MEVREPVWCRGRCYRLNDHLEIYGYAVIGVITLLRSNPLTGHLILRQYGQSEKHIRIIRRHLKMKLS